LVNRNDASLAEVHGRASAFFRKRIKELRAIRNWTQEEAAEACGLDYKLYQFYELGIKPNPGLQTLEKIATGFGLGLHEMFAPQLPPKAASSKPRRTRSKAA
jgi:transcriptional regulator with XRE-family HTH domain